MSDGGRIIRDHLDQPSHVTDEKRPQQGQDNLVSDVPVRSRLVSQGENSSHTAVLHHRLVSKGWGRAVPTLLPVPSAAFGT
jgi:hypothetical protein